MVKGAEAVEKVDRLQMDQDPFVKCEKVACSHFFRVKKGMRMSCLFSRLHARCGVKGFFDKLWKLQQAAISYFMHAAA